MPSGSFLSRLARDTGGNTLAIMAAAFFPLAGLIGGAVDMTRIYITKTRLQQACDAGALAGRKVMASGSWSTSGSESSRERAYQMFASNFASGDFGTEGLSREFTEDEGTVTGVASADVPMTIMQIFGKTTQAVSVTCTAKMEIPNTDVMFVLDITGSMNSNNKIDGLRSAVKCFYEALMRVDTPEVCGSDPTAATYDGTAQIRMGFVPYSVNVNVGKLLPTSFIADEWTYQTRQANTTTVYAWNLESEGSEAWGGWSTPPISAAYYSGWSDISTSGGSTVSINGVTYTKRPSGYTWATCDSLNTMGPSGNRMVAQEEGNVVVGAETENGGPVYPATNYTAALEQEALHEIRGYRYKWGTNGTDSCRLQRSNLMDFTLERNGTVDRTVSWTEHERWDDWTYDIATLDVSGLKDDSGAWNGTVPLANVDKTTVSLKLSGSSTAQSVQIPAPRTATWDGCLEERQTFQNTDGNPSDDWDPIPAAALDMDIDLVPSDAVAGSKWGPMLDEAVWRRYSGGYFRTEPVTTSDDLWQGYVTNSYYCSTESRLLAEYLTSGSFVSYIDGFTPAGNTYHDVGLLWGARLLSPTGIFAADNALTADGGAIERHMIFMTDGDAVAANNNLYSFGFPTLDRRQMSYSPTSGQMTNAIEARMLAICTQVKNMNVKLWVISYGGGVDAANEARLEACASPGHYYEAADGAALIAQFQQIASEIADLRLTE